MPKLSRVLNAGALTALLAGCAGPIMGPTYISPSYDPSDLNFPANAGGVPTEIIGNPFDASAGDLAFVVTDELSKRPFGPKLNFITETPAAFGSPFRAVVLFSPARNARSERICAEPEQPQEAREPGDVKVMAAYCNGARLVNSTVGVDRGLAGVDDPKLRELIAAVRRELLPPRNPSLLGDGASTIFVE